MDRTVVQGMVEDYWRALLPAMQAGNPGLCLEMGSRFDQRIEATAARLDPIEAAAFQQTIEAERERLMAEYQADPVALKKRLGVALGVDAPANRRADGSGLGEIVVRTAVRATVWESVWALFRLGR